MLGIRLSAMRGKTESWETWVTGDICSYPIQSHIHTFSLFWCFQKQNVTFSSLPKFFLYKDLPLKLHSVAGA